MNKEELNKLTLDIGEKLVKVLEEERHKHIIETKSPEDINRNLFYESTIITAVLSSVLICHMQHVIDITKEITKVIGYPEDKIKKLILDYIVAAAATISTDISKLLKQEKEEKENKV